MIYTITLNPAIDRTIEVEQFTPFDVNAGRLVKLLPAGKGINVSRMLSTLGTPSVALGFVGRKDVPLYHTSLENTLVEPEFTVLDSATRQNITIIDPSRGQDETHVREEGPVIDRDTTDTFKDLLRSRLRNGDRVAVSGSLPPGISPYDLRDMLAICSDAGAEVFLDAHGQTLRTCSEIAHYIKPNLLELQSMLEDPSEDIDELLRALRAFRPHDASLVTCGRHGAYYIHRTVRIYATADTESLIPVNSVGCGDAFLAGFVHDCDSGNDEEISLRTAVACATACLLSPAADVESKALVTQLSHKVTSKRL